MAKSIAPCSLILRAFLSRTGALAIVVGPTVEFENGGAVTMMALPGEYELVGKFLVSGPSVPAYANGLNGSAGIQQYLSNLAARGFTVEPLPINNCSVPSKTYDAVASNFDRRPIIEAKSAS